MKHSPRLRFAIAGFSRLREIILAASAALAAGTAAGQTTFSDAFPSSSSFSSNYTSGYNGFTWSSGVGTGGSSGLYFYGGGGGGRATLNSSVATFDNVTGTTNKVSAFFRASGIPNGPDYVQIEVGFHDPNSSAYGHLTLTNYGSSSQFIFSANTASAPLPGGSGVGFGSNEWYRLELTLVRSSTANTFAVTALLENWGSGGTSFVSQVYSGSPTNGTFAGYSPLYSASVLVPTVSHTWFSDVGTNTLYVDNLSVSSASAIPEPSTYAVCLGLAALGGTWCWKRRRRTATVIVS